MSLRRFAGVLVVLFRHSVGALCDQATRRGKILRSWGAAPLSGPERLRRLFEELGGIYIKFGQMLALQPDIISPEYCNALFDLLDRVAPFPATEVERTFVEEFGKKPCELFDIFHPEPLASASIGQVHVAWIHGRKLAVKVQRPSVERDFGSDIRLMNSVMWLIGKLRLRALSWLIEPMSEFVAWTREELDYRYEARYLRQLRQNARDNPNECFPGLLDEFTTRRILVMEFLEGCTVLNYLRAMERGDTRVIDDLEAAGFDSHMVASRIVDNFLGDVFRHGIFHADLHPANLIILPGNRVGYIDFGITGTISSYSRQNLVALTLAYTRGDLDAMCESFFRVSIIDTRSSEARFREGLARQAKNWYESSGAGLRLRKNFTRVMLDMSRLSLQCGVRPARDVVTYIRSSVAIDGLITRFAPTFDLGAHLETVCASHLKWHLRRSVFTFDNLLGSAIQLVRLFRDSGPRALGAMEWLTVPEPDRYHHRDPLQREDGVSRDRAIYSAAFLCAVCFSAWVSPEKFGFGMNLFTSELALAGAALLLLMNNLRRLPKENERA
jgi:ubiquinone biosynthesis protein